MSLQHGAFVEIRIVLVIYLTEGDNPYEATQCQSQVLR